MAQNFVNVGSLTYSGQEAREIFSKDIYDLDLRSYGIKFIDNVKGKRKIYDGELDDVWQEYSCPFTPSGAATLAESFIEPARIKVNMENCYDSWDDTYFVEQTEITLNGGVPQTFSEWFFDRLRKKMSKEYQEIFWQGDTAHAAETKKYLKVTDGIEKRLNGGEGVKLISGTKFTLSNIIEQVEAAVMAAIENAAKQGVDTENYKIFMNHSDIKLLAVALGKECCISNSDVAIFKNYSKEGDKIYAMGFEIVPTMQSASSIIVGPATNLVLGFDTYDSHLEYKLIDMRETSGDNMFRVIAQSNIAVGILFPELFVYSRVVG